MITIAIELNHVIRNINKQLLKYYKRDYHPELDIDNIDCVKENVLDKYIKFNSKKERNEFIYIDYPYEIFGCAKTMDKELAPWITKYLVDLSNYEEDDVELFFFSMNEESLTIQSSFFFLSKIGTRVRKIVFPRKYDEIKSQCDVVITASAATINAFEDKETIYKVLIDNPLVTDIKDKANKVYSSLIDFIKNEGILHKLHEFVNLKKNKK